MKNKKYFTPNDINKFIYCPYQWYYEKYYGRKHVRSLYEEKNKKLNLKNEVQSNFSRGKDFHDNYYKKNDNLAFKGLFLFFIFILVLYFIIKYL